jgi:hypothetical protein
VRVGSLVRLAAAFALIPLAAGCGSGAAARAPDVSQTPRPAQTVRGGLPSQRALVVDILHALGGGPIAAVEIGPRAPAADTQVSNGPGRWLAIRVHGDGFVAAWQANLLLVAYDRRAARARLPLVGGFTLTGGGRAVGGGTIGGGVHVPGGIADARVLAAFRAMAAHAGFGVRRITLLHPSGTAAEVVLDARGSGPAHVNLDHGVGAALDRLDGYLLTVADADGRVVARFASAGNLFAAHVTSGWACHRPVFEPVPADPTLCRKR